MQYPALFPRGWHIVSWRHDGRIEHYTPGIIDTHLNLGLKGNAWEAQALADEIATRLRSDRVEAYFDGRLMARAAGAPAALAL